MQREKEGIGLLPLFVSLGGCLHVGCLRLFFFLSACLEYVLLALCEQARDEGV